MEQLHALEVVQRQAAAIQGEILVEMADRGPLAEYGSGSLPALLRDVLPVDLAEGKRRVARALACHTHHGAVGEVPPAAPQTAQALRDGEVGVRQAEAVAETVSRIPEHVPESSRRESEGYLLRPACQATAPAVWRAGKHLLRYVHDDDPPPDDEDRPEPRRELRWSWRRDGRLNLAGIVDAETGHALETALSPLAKPQPATDGTPDTRPPEQRQGDAFAAMVGLVLDEGKLPAEGGEKPRLVIT
ncbi:DUF222 domain-containing protein, partial [Haloechinothrix sp. LS1_15]|uniref:DUF222 domain-containing protein n=1 Tax=Haloechinothrix sp. LS1_15 TaxID=2652248 RepID=UPI00294B7404